MQAQYDDLEAKFETIASAFEELRNEENRVRVINENI